MKRIKVMSIFGTRPEAIKMAPVIKTLEEERMIKSIITVTAQHREMLDQVLDLFSIQPDYDLNIMKSDQSLVEITVRILTKLTEVIKQVGPDLILVHGDTSTTFAGALASFYHQIEVGHIETGLRSYNKYFPYPEEINRHLTGVLANLHFTPTIMEKNNLVAENINQYLFVTGNTVIDALLSVIDDNYQFFNPLLDRIDFNHKIILLTAHRRENLGRPLQEICYAVKEIVEENQDVEVIFPVHPNPKVKKISYSLLNDIERVHLIAPLSYQDFANLLASSYLVLTDSGGVQEEAPSLGKPVLVLRNETERKEALKAGVVKLVGTKRESIISTTNQLLNDKEEYQKMISYFNPYGDGKASQRIVEAILYYFGYREDKPSEFNPQLQELYT